MMTTLCIQPINCVLLVSMNVSKNEPNLFEYIYLTFALKIAYNIWAHTAQQSCAMQMYESKQRTVLSLEAHTEIKSIETKLFFSSFENLAKKNEIVPTPTKKTLPTEMIYSKRFFYQNKSCWSSKSDWVRFTHDRKKTILFHFCVAFFDCSVFLFPSHYKTTTKN